MNTENEDLLKADRTPVVVEKWLLQAVFDTAINGMDFGSGFLDESQTEALRALAVVLGVDPMVATPENMKCNYDPDGHGWTKFIPVNPRYTPSQRGSVYWRCHRCGKTVYDDPTVKP